MVYGTLSSFDTLASSQQSLAAYGLDNAFEALRVQLAAHNMVARDMFATIADRTVERQRRYGAATSKTMQEVDEHGVVDAQKVSAGVTLGFPLRKYQNALQWTDLFLQRARADEFAKEVVAIQDADLMQRHSAVRKALFTATNYTFNDLWLDHVDLAVKALINADSSALPPGPNGEVFNAASHTHYLANATLTAAVLLNLVNTVIEHFATGTCEIGINATDAAAVQALSGFVGLVDVDIVQPNTATYVRGGLDVVNTNNRLIGKFNGAWVYVKPWVPAGYAAAWMRGERALMIRTDPVLGGGDLNIEWRDERYVLQSNGYSSYYGVGVWQRHAAAVLDFGHGSYTTPTGL